MFFNIDILLKLLGLLCKHEDFMKCLSIQKTPYKSSLLKISNHHDFQSENGIILYYTCSFQTLLHLKKIQYYSYCTQVFPINS